MKYFKRPSGELLVDPIESKYSDLIEMTKQEFDEQLAINNAPPELSKEQMIQALELTITNRWLRMSSLGDAYAISKLQEIEDQIEIIRNS